MKPGLAGRSYAVVVGLLLRRRDEAELRDLSLDAGEMLDGARRAGTLRLARVWLALTWDAVRAAVRYDLPQTLRRRIRDPRFTIGASAFLGAGFAITTSLFALVNAALLRPLPYPGAERLIAIWETTQWRARQGPAPGNFADWAARYRGADAITAWSSVPSTIDTGNAAFPADAAQVTRGFFDVFGVAPAQGRVFTTDEYEGARPRAGIGAPVVVISDRLWRSLGAPPDALSRTLSINGRMLRIVGVMPRGFTTPGADSALWLPWDIQAAYARAQFPAGPPRDFRFLRVAARLRQDETTDSAGRQLDAIATVIAREHPATNGGWGVEVVPLADDLSRDSTAVWLLLLGITCLLGVIAANFAGLTVARSTQRARDLAIRSVLGAGRARLVAQEVAEAAAISGLSAAIGLALSYLLLDVVRVLAPRDFPRLTDVTLDWRVVAFTLLSACVMAVISGVLAARPGLGVDLLVRLKDGGPQAGTRHHALRRGLVAGQLAVMLVLLVLAGLFARTFGSLRAASLGFDPENLVVMRIALDPTRYRSHAQTVAYYTRLLESLRALPGVRSATAATALPLSAIGSDFDRPFWAAGSRPAGTDTGGAHVRMIAPDYFQTLRRPLRGRDFSAADTAGSPRVIIVNETLARTLWPRQEATGRSLVLDYLGGAYTYSVVGVAGDVRHRGGRDTPAPEIFIPHAQNPYLLMNVVVRPEQDPLSVAAAARRASQEIDPAQPLHSVTTMDALLEESLQRDRARAQLFVLFALAAGLVAVSGVYALCAATVSGRRHELAVRIAIGASRTHIAWLVLREALTLALAGMILGIAGAVLAGRAFASVLFGIGSVDVVTLSSSGALLVAVVVASTWPAAQRAMRITPIQVLKG